MREIYMERVDVVEDLALFDLTVDGKTLLRRRPLLEVLERISCETSAEIRSEKEATT